MKKLVAILLVFITLMTCAAAEVYVRGAMVSKVNVKKDYIKFTDCEGNIWRMDDAANWREGDIVLLWFYDNETFDRKDDVILDYRWTGFNMKSGRSEWGEGVQ